MRTCLKRNCQEPIETGSLFCSDHNPQHVTVCEELVVETTLRNAADLLRQAVAKGYIKPSTRYVAVA